MLLRRVRALLERQQLAVSDETGWKLSTTRAGATVVGLLRATQPQASTDEWLDWLKSSPRPWPGLDALEAACRRGAITALRQVDAARLEGAAAALWREWVGVSDSLRTGGRRSLAEWLLGLRAALQRAGVWDALLGDAAGAQVLDALHCRGEPTNAWARQASAARFDAAEFRRWVESVLEQVAFQPPDAPLDGAPPEVVITPLSRAMLRPFAAVVCPGADEARLGAAPPPQPLLGDALARALGLPGSAEQRAAEEAAFAQLLRAPRLSVLHRLRDGSEPLQPSALLLRLQFAAQRAGRPLRAAPDARPLQALAAQPVERPAPSAAALLPDTLNATAYEALRACPYRFFAQRLLRLDEADELDDAIDKRAYGIWLHAVLQDFHRRRDAADPAGDAALLQRIAADQQALLERDDADFLPYAAWFEQLAPRYLTLLHGEEAAGLRVRETELALHAAPAALAAVRLSLRGQIDRVDRLGTGAEERLRIVDYKTSSNSVLRERLKQPLEDTQLPFYAAVLATAETLPPAGVEAAYLALDGREGAVVLAHAEVQASAARLLEGIAADYGRLRAGAAMPALGEGSACEHCSARGLCRRDHWSEAPGVSAGP
jgi:ATP-dependent helicase/nuclease subunit B